MERSDLKNAQELERQKQCRRQHSKQRRKLWQKRSRNHRQKMRRKQCVWRRVIVLWMEIACIGVSAAYVTRWPRETSAWLQVWTSLQAQEETKAAAKGTAPEVQKLFAALRKDAECFPVRAQNRRVWKTPAAEWSYEDGYGEGRSYGGKRSHEGIDIMPLHAGRGELAIQSVSDGTVEKLGWLELGGYRVGIRSRSGLYFYYAHLDAYAPGLAQGEQVKKGELLGYMGDTGYGKEGTRGKFPVHLHFGVYYDRDGQERSINPYALLRSLDIGGNEEDYGDSVVAGDIRPVLSGSG